FPINLEAVHVATTIVDKIKLVETGRGTRLTVKLERNSNHRLRRLPGRRGLSNGRECVEERIQDTGLTGRVAPEDASERIAHRAPVAILRLESLQRRAREIDRDLVADALVVAYGEAQQDHVAMIPLSTPYYTNFEPID